MNWICIWHQFNFFCSIRSQFSLIWTPLFKKLPQIMWEKGWKCIHDLYGYTGCRVFSFQTGVTKLEKILPKNQHTQRKLLSFENWVNAGEVSKSTKIWLSKSILYDKNYEKSSSIFFPFKNLIAHFLLLTFFDNTNFLNHFTF